MTSWWQPTRYLQRAALLGKIFRGYCFHVQVFEATVLISARIETVWDILTDSGNLTVWNSGLATVDGEIKDGARIRIRTDGGRRRNIHLRVRQLPGYVMRWRGVAFLGLVRENFTVSLTQHTGTTRFTARHELRGPLLRFTGASPMSSDEHLQSFAGAVKDRAELLHRHS
jgi:uncharacterized protein YndB with AHSA1/START domain